MQMCPGHKVWDALTGARKAEIAAMGNGVKCMCNEWLVEPHIQPVTLYKSESGMICVHKTTNVPIGAAEPTTR